MIHSESGATPRKTIRHQHNNRRLSDISQSDFPVCYVCGGGETGTVNNPGARVSVLGVNYYCSTLHRQGRFGNLDPSICNQILSEESTFFEDCKCRFIPTSTIADNSTSVAPPPDEGGGKSLTLPISIGVAAFVMFLLAIATYEFGRKRKRDADRAQVVEVQVAQQQENRERAVHEQHRIEQQLQQQQQALRQNQQRAREFAAAQDIEQESRNVQLRGQVLRAIFPEQKLHSKSLLYDEDIQSFRWNKEELAIGSTTCSICFERFQSGNTILQSGLCHHTFHRSCVMEWIIRPRHNECPSCRQPMYDEETYQMLEMELRAPSLPMEEGNHENIGNVGDLVNDDTS